MMGWNMGWGGMWLGGLTMILVWGGLIVLAFFALRVFTNYPSAGNLHEDAGRDLRHAPQAPLDVLKTRYAKGEIGRDEYERIRQDLLTS